jgi:hypothetical protein
MQTTGITAPIAALTPMDNPFSPESGEAAIEVELVYEVVD